MGYVLLLLFFLIWRNTVQIRKAINYAAYGTTKNQGVIYKMFNAFYQIRTKEVEENKKRKEEKKKEKEVEENV